MVLTVLENTICDPKAEVLQVSHKAVGGDFSMNVLRVSETLKSFFEERMIKRTEENLQQDKGR
jgi:hypothetical protein